MKSLLLALLFTSALSFAQTEPKAAYAEFKKEFETYRDNPLISSENSTITPAPCGQYTLKFMVTAQGFDEIVSVPPAKKLCADLMRFDKSKNPNSSPDWEYEIKPVGNRYYVIRGQKKGGNGLQELYYYEHKTNK
ncbi:MAG TPA: hypothetical protein VF581_04350 [Flavobacterium sp.]|jgi:hypothetical protein